MISWVVLAVLVIAGVLALKMNHLRHKVFIIILVIVALFFYSTFLYVNNQHNLDFSTTEGFTESMDVYLGWLANSFTNLKQLTGNAIRMDWPSTEGAFVNKTK
jgi:hypothetical protein